MPARRFTARQGRDGHWKGEEKRLHEWVAHNFQSITTIIAGHTHRTVFENFSITERRYRESKTKTEGTKIKHHSDKPYYNDGSCVHPCA